MKRVITLFAVLLMGWSVNAWSFACKTANGTAIPIGGGSANVYVNLAPVVNVGQNLVVDLSTQIFCHNDYPETITDYVTLQRGSAYGGVLSNFSGTVKYSGSSYPFPTTSETPRVVYNSRTDKPWPVALYLTPVSSAGGVAIKAGSLIAVLILRQTNNYNSDDFQFVWNIYANNDVVVPTGGCDVSARDVTVTLPDYPGSVPIPLTVYCAKSQNLGYYLSGTTADAGNSIFTNTASFSPAQGVGVQLTRNGTIIPANNTVSLGAVGTSAVSLGLTANYARTGGQVTLEATTFRTVGLLHQEWWMRPDDPADADEKESGKWLAAAATSRLRMGSMMSNVIAVCDREADIHAYLQDKLAHNERFVVRSKHPRKDVESGLYLYDHLKNQPELGGYQISIPQKGVVDKRGKRKNRPARKASLSLRSGRITLKQGNITLNAVLAEEINPPKGETPLKWLLLTSEPVESLAQALRVIDIYTHRWRIEEFHKAWKTGAGAERQRMEEPDNLERMVSILSFVAVRLLQLRESFTLPQALRAQGLLKEAEHVESQSAETVLTPDECQLLGYLDKGKRKRKEKAGSLQWAYMAIARLGGFMDSKRTGIASWGALW